MQLNDRSGRNRLFGSVAFVLSALCAKQVFAAEPVLNALGQSGGLVIPYGTVLLEGTGAFEFNNYVDPRYANQATGGQSYLLGFGVFPYVEISGGLVNYPALVSSVRLPGAEADIIRHLSANVKVQIPHFFTYQPDIAVGATDFGGQTRYFRSTYVVASQTFGLATLAVGYGLGPQRLNGIFGGGEFAIWKTGISLLAEDDNTVAYAGIRYRSPPIRWLGNAMVVGTAQRALNPGNVNLVNRTSVSIALQIPLGGHYSAAQCAQSGSCSPKALPAASRSVNTTIDDESPTVVSMGSGSNDVPSRMVDTKDDGARPLSSSANTSLLSVQDRSWLAANGGNAKDDAEAPAPANFAIINSERLSLIQLKLIELGFENVAVGRVGRNLAIEYENHRYNQNEADALGIVFGVAASLAPKDIVRIFAVIKKADQAIGQVSVDREAYVSFLNGASDSSVSYTVLFHTRPTYEHDQVDWVSSKEGPHGLARLEIEPATSYVFGTEYGKFDYSVGANIEGFVPLWKGAELYTSFIEPISNSRNMDNGHAFSGDRLHRGLADVTLNQIIWPNKAFLNLASVGKFDFHYAGVEDETTFFVPGRPDLIRLKLAYLHPFSNGNKNESQREENAVLLYRWVQPSWNMWVEAGAARYVGGDRGPIFSVVRWFDDVSLTGTLSHSGLGTFAGVALSFPLTPRQGMKPGIIQVSGSESFPVTASTRIGSANFLNTNAVQDVNFAYSTQKFLLNQGRFSDEYFRTQLYRMRDAYRTFGVPKE